MPVVEKPLPGAARGNTVAKKRSDAGKPDESSGRGRPSIGRQINVRLNDELLTELEYIAEVLGADLSHVIRSILSEFSSIHAARARKIRADREQERKAREGGE